MAGRIKRAREEYKNKMVKGNKGKFKLADLEEILELNQGAMGNSIACALEAGYMLGYEAGRKSRATGSAAK